MNVERIRIVGVMGSGTEPHEERARPLGRWLAELGVHLLTGGGSGVMEAVSRAFCSVVDRRGLSIGVLPAAAETGKPREGYPSPWTEIPICTHLPLSGVQGTALESRNHINVLSSDLIIALPGSLGTSSEVQLALRYEKPIIAYVKSRQQIPDLPEEVPTSNDLAVIQAFVSRQLDRLDKQP